MYYDLVVVGGGPAGLAAAEEAKKNGAGSVLIIERDKELGGILNQCIHDGFGVERFGEALSGPEYVARFLPALEQEGITKVNLVVFSRNQKGDAFWAALGFSLRTDLNYRDKRIVPAERMDT